MTRMSSPLAFPMKKPTRLVNQLPDLMAAAAAICSTSIQASDCHLFDSFSASFFFNVYIYKLFVV